MDDKEKTQNEAADQNSTASVTDINTVTENAPKKYRAITVEEMEEFFNITKSQDYLKDLKETAGTSRKSRCTACSLNIFLSHVEDVQQHTGDHDFSSGTIDRCLNDYFELSAQLSMDQRVRLPSFLVNRVDKQIKSTIENRKGLLVPLPESKERHYVITEFAAAAYIDILGKQLFTRETSFKKNHAPQRICTFFSEEDISAKEREACEDVILDCFQLDDYILYERITGVSFCVEACAALSCIENKIIRSLCLDVLERNLDVFITSPLVFSRIDVMRQFLFDASAKIMSQQMYPDEGTVITKEMQTALVQNVLDEAVNKWVSRPPITNRCWGSRSEMSVCLERLRNTLKNFTEPADFMEHISSEEYGPVIFCNPRHRRVHALLEDVRMFQTNRDMKELKVWEPFPHLCQRFFEYRMDWMKKLRTKRVPKEPSQKVKTDPCDAKIPSNPK